MLRFQWFWITLGCLGYLFSLYGVLAGLGLPTVCLTLLIVLSPLLLTHLPLQVRLKGVTVAAVIMYFFSLVVLVENSYFPSTASMITELFFVLLVTIPAFIPRRPMYLLFGAGSVDQWLLLIGFLFLCLFLYGIVRLPHMQKRSLHMMLAMLLLAMYITTSECVALGQGIRMLSREEHIDRSVRDYYRVAMD